MMTVAGKKMSVRHHAMLLLLLSVLLVVVPPQVKSAREEPKAVLQHSWVKVEYDWPNDTMEEQYLSSKRFIISNNVVAGIKLYKKELYLTVPRWRRGVPSTLNRVIMKEGKAVLQPYPSWQMQTVGDCEALQYVQSMEVDPNTGYMWILDTGRLDILDDTPPRNLCPPKLVIYNLDHNTEVHRYTFPNEVVNHTASFLDDLVLDYVNGDVRFVYITDTLYGKLYVYNYENNTSYVFEDSAMQADTEGGFTIDGIAMSYHFDYVYFCPLDGLALYQIPTFVLRDPNANFTQHVRRVGERVGRSGGLAYGQQSLFYSLLDLNGLRRWNVTADAQKDGYSKVLLQTQDLLASDDLRMPWVDSLGWGKDGYLWFTTNDLNQFLNRSLDFSGGSGPNMYVFKVFVGESSYLVDAPARTKRSTSVASELLAEVGAVFLALASYITLGPHP